MRIDHLKSLRPAGKGFLADCPSCGYKNAFSVSIKNGKQLFHCHAGCSRNDILRIMQEEGPRRSSDHAPQTFVKPTKDISKVIHELWASSLLANGTLVETYLQSRGICGKIPTSIRYLYNHKHTESGLFFPVMIAAVFDYHENLRAIHRTFLSHDGKSKANVEPAKKILGQVKGLATQLAPATEELIITEGIETGLSVMEATGKPVWAALSSGGIQNLILPPLPLASEITIAADADPVGLRAASIAAHRFGEEGRKVKIATPPQGMDFNDVLRSAAI